MGAVDAGMSQDRRKPSTSSASFVGVRADRPLSPRLSRFGRYAGPMDTHRAQFDSHRFVKRLTKAGLSEEVAEVLADEHANLIVPADVATKRDVAAVSTDLASVRSEMATKADLAECEARMEQRLQNAILEAKISLIKWMIATMAVFSGVVIGAVAALQ